MLSVTAVIKAINCLMMIVLSSSVFNGSLGTSIPASYEFSIMSLLGDTMLVLAGTRRYESNY